MPYPVATDPEVVRDLQRKLRKAIDEHLLWAFNPQYAQPRSRS
jgi:hypothetical protein